MIQLLVTLAEWGVKNEEMLFVVLIPNTMNVVSPNGWESVFSMSKWWAPSVPQTDKGMSNFLSALYMVV